MRHVERGKLLPRDRVDGLLDPGSPLLEIAPLAADGMYDDDCPAAGIIAGIGRVSGRECMIVANDATVKGGTYYPVSVKNTCARRRSPPRTGCPASTWWTPEGVPAPSGRGVPRPRPLRQDFLQPGHHERRGYRPDRRGAGSCTAGGAYVPAMSDEAVIVRNQGTIFLGGPRW